MNVIISVVLLFLACTGFSQEWTEKQISEANTAVKITILSKIEKDIIKYINLTRLYPKQFVKNEIANYYGSSKYGEDLTNSTYKASLIKHLNTMQAVGILQFDIEAYENAKCLGKEQEKNGSIGHKRKKCKDGAYGECCSYGMDTGKDVIMQWLVDEKLQSVGHRLNCLNKSYTKIGVSVNPHKKWDVSSIADFY